MRIALLILEFHLQGCCSLKQKRQRLLGLRDRFGKLPLVAVIESDHADLLDRAQWSFVVLGANRVLIEKQIQLLINGALEVDAEICEQQVEWL